MKVDVIALTVDVVIVVVYHNFIKFDVTIFKKLTIANNITVYNETSIIQTQIVNVIEIYFNF